jgi:hypothetical protein
MPNLLQLGDVTISTKSGTEAFHGSLFAKRLMKWISGSLPAMRLAGFKYPEFLKHVSAERPEISKESAFSFTSLPTLPRPCSLVEGDYLNADCIALFVHRTAQLSDLPAEEREAVEKHLRFAPTPDRNARAWRQ